MREVELSEAIGALMWGLRKGAGHKYIRRVPKAGGGYRYYYRVSGVTRDVGADLQAGAKFRLTHDGQEGHFEVTGRSGDRVTLRHDESGGTMTVSASELGALLHREHADVVTAKRKAVARDLAQARKTGSAKQIARLEAEAKRHGVNAAPASREDVIADITQAVDKVAWPKRWTQGDRDRLYIEHSIPGQAARRRQKGYLDLHTGRFEWERPAANRRAASLRESIEKIVDDRADALASAPAAEAPKPEAASPAAAPAGEDVTIPTAIGTRVSASNPGVAKNLRESGFTAEEVNAQGFIYLHKLAPELRAVPDGRTVEVRAMGRLVQTITRNGDEWVGTDLSGGRNNGRVFNVPMKKLIASARRLDGHLWMRPAAEPPASAPKAHSDRVAQTIKLSRAAGVASQDSTVYQSGPGGLREAVGRMSGTPIGTSEFEAFDTVLLTNRRRDDAERNFEGTKKSSPRAFREAKAMLDRGASEPELMAKLKRSRGESARVWSGAIALREAVRDERRAATVAGARIRGDRVWGVLEAHAKAYPDDYSTGALASRVNERRMKRLPA